MRNATYNKILLTLAMLGLVAGALWQFFKRGPQPQPVPNAAPAVSKSEDNFPHPLFSATKAVGQPSEADAAESKRISREKVEAWLTLHQRTAASLLTAFRASQDTNYLNEAAANFPNDPQVEWTILGRHAFPEDRRRWLDLFKTSSPSNSVANYLSAQDYFKNGQTNAAINELSTATGKAQFGGFSIESLLEDEQLHQFAGKSAAESAQLALAGIAGDFLGSLTAYKILANNLRDLAQADVAAGDVSAAQNLAQLGLAFADQIRSGDSGKLLISQMVANAVQAIALSQLDQNTSYDFLDGQTPDQLLQQMKQQKNMLNELRSNFSAVYPNMTDQELAGYAARMKIYGEVKAMNWAVQQHPSGTP